MQRRKNQTCNVEKKNFQKSHKMYIFWLCGTYNVILVSKTGYYTEFFEFRQQKINFNFYELSLPEDDPVLTYTNMRSIREIDRIVELCRRDLAFLKKKEENAT